MLQCIDDKDVFQKCCTQVLATRLLQRLSVSEGMEEKLMHKFGDACGNGYAWTLQRMFRDVSASKEVNEQFVRHIKNSNECFRLDFSIHVLASGLWPFRLSSHLKLPPELEGIVQSFATFYSGLYSTRKIQPLHDLSKGE
ncbi:hypothetical protein HPB48_015491 [Haemaphysalis longicornis]|uniref:Cullin family profile domain-containing protein n=1 Tax=Haemaphysalis longicornis TaxID=44386 RepID=A0A9J6FI29_HAELO|nr:hypothetical protein HPB48_015491 [Haemaphysalis longicornis]